MRTQFRFFVAAAAAFFIGYVPSIRAPVTFPSHTITETERKGTCMHRIEGGGNMEGSGGLIGLGLPRDSRVAPPAPAGGHLWNPMQAIHAKLPQAPLMGPWHAGLVGQATTSGLTLLRSQCG